MTVVVDANILIAYGLEDGEMLIEHTICLILRESFN